MRLTHIKVAGFKSFVDPIHVAVPGQLVGIVGPNGCGKSNIIDAVRWVLGESSAKHLRGETMQDVIFNGSGGRKPVARASVELVFDNSEGRAGGQWTAYNEIAVKRVLQRNGDSSYYINNLHVRRRDVTDIFLGTGLGARAYAIIEQGMISRVIEAKPDELRIFLEEAAGISVYKERRRETELRLRDTRENLLRVDDIRQELEGQLLKLEAQAAVAQKYHALQAELATSQNIFWWLKKREAQGLWERTQRDVQRFANDLEAETAKLRQAENQLEQTRSKHYESSDALHGAQAEMYSANAEVAKLEQEIHHQRENRQRLTIQVNSLQEQQGQLHSHHEQSAQSLAHWKNELEAAQNRVSETSSALESARAGLPEAEQAFQGAQSRFNELQRNLAEAEQARRVEETHFSHAERNLQQFQNRLQRLQQDQAQLQQPDAAQLQQNKDELAKAASEQEQALERLNGLQQSVQELERAWQEAQRAAQEKLNQSTRLEGRLHALEQLQNSINQDEKLKAWLDKYGLSRQARLWQNLKIEDGWDQAVESLLQQRVNGFAVDFLSAVENWLGDAPPGALTVYESVQGVEENTPAGNLTALQTRVQWKGTGSGAFLNDWFHGVYLAESAGEALKHRLDLKPGEVLVTREGFLVTRHSMSLHGERSELHGILARQREIETLVAELGQLEAENARLTADAEKLEQQVGEAKTQVSAQQTLLAEARQRFHRLQMENQRLTQLEQQYVQRSGQINREMSEVQASILAESEQETRCEDLLKQQRSQIEQLIEHLQDAKLTRSNAEASLNQQRQALQQAERAAQEANFNSKNCANKINDLENNIRSLDENLTRIGSDLERSRAELSGFDEAPLKQRLNEALANKQQSEVKLAQMREALSVITNELENLEAERLATEQKLNPLRDKLEQSRLKEQEARLHNEQCESQLREAGANEEELGQLASGMSKPDAAQVNISKLKQDIEALGPVNLAALDELKASQERKQYLDSQAGDLREAVDTLEQAIKKIDKETRARLQETYDIVNGNFKDLFPSIFGGGHAELILTGEEILDAGIQLVAQPPGKRNSSIHLLSGGEKALTAMALVFSLFKLNPAPFCMLDEVDAPLDDTNTERFCELVKKMSSHTQFMFVTHNKITMEMAQQLVGVTMPESGVSRVVAVDVESAMKLTEQAA